MQRAYDERQPLEGAGSLSPLLRLEKYETLEIVAVRLGAKRRARRQHATRRRG